MAHVMSHLIEDDVIQDVASRRFFRTGAIPILIGHLSSFWQNLPASADTLMHQKSKCPSSQPKT